MTRYRRVNILAPCGYSALSNARTLREPAFMPYFNKTLPRVLPLFDACVYHSSTYQDHAFATLLGLTNSVVIPNAVDAAEFEAPSALSFRAMHGIKEKHLLLCVANFFPKKGHDRVIDCFRAMKSKDTVLVFIGKEGEELGNLRKAAEGLNVRFCVGIPREQTVAAYREADLFLFGSYIEASPLVIIEAKASRTAFVSTDCGNVKEWKGGIVCAPEEMAMHAGRLLVDDAERKALAEEGWREWKDRLTWDAVITQYEDLYLRLCDEKARFIRKNTLLTSMPLEDKIARCQSNIERDYTDPYWYLCAAGFAEEAGRKDDALRYLEDALELDPTDTGLRERFEQAKVSV